MASRNSHTRQGRWLCPSSSAEIATLSTEPYIRAHLPGPSLATFGYIFNLSHASSSLWLSVATLDRLIAVDDFTNAGWRTQLDGHIALICDAEQNFQRLIPAPGLEPLHVDAATAFTTCRMMADAVATAVETEDPTALTRAISYRKLCAATYEVMTQGVNQYSRDLSTTGHTSTGRSTPNSPMEEDVNKFVDKTCRRCGRTLPTTLGFFGQHLHCRDGLRPNCRTCHTQVLVERRQRQNERSRAWTATNRDKVRASVRKSSRRNRRARTEYMRHYREENRERLCEYVRAYSARCRAESATPQPAS